MRKLAFLLLFSGLAGPLFAAKRVTVEQLEHIVSAARGSDDAKAAQQLYELALTERLSAARLARAQADLPGPAARQALMAVADASAFLDLPRSDIPDAPAPTHDAQNTMWALAIDYASKIISRLPDFFATRDTLLFQDTPSQPPRSTTDTIKYEPLHAQGSQSVTVLYRDGREFVESAGKQRKKYDASNYELSASGEFGPIIATVLADAGQGSVNWSHWEQGDAGPMAVFRYAAPKEASHYTVTFPGPARNTQLLPAYHGEIGINPADGSILRLTMVADLTPADPVTSANLLVEYGTVEIGGKTYICPLKSVALSLVPVVQVESNSMSGEHPSRGPAQTRVNDVVFRQYHLFRAEVRILSDDDVQQNGNQPGSAPEPTPPPNPQH